MSETETKFNEFCTSAKDNKLPRWNELPEFDLYMDQTVSIISKYISPYFGNEPGKNITSSMINNYVKLKIAPAPVKKKYSKRHIACLIMISILKQVLNMSELRFLITSRNELLGEQAAYDSFCNQIEQTVNNLCSVYTDDAAKPDLIKCSDDTSLMFAAIAFGGKLLSERLISLDIPEEIIEEKKDKDREKEKKKEEKKKEKEEKKKNKED